MANAKHPNDDVIANPFTAVQTLIVDARRAERQLALIEGASWPPNGAIVELIEPNRDAQVVDVHLTLSRPDKSATILIYVQPGDEL